MSSTVQQLVEESAREVKEMAFLVSCVVGLMSLAATLVIGRWLEHRQIFFVPQAAVGILIGAATTGIASASTFDSDFDVDVNVYVDVAAGIDVDIDVNDVIKPSK